LPLLPFLLLKAGYTALLWTCIFNKSHIDVVKMLVDRGANTEARDAVSFNRRIEKEEGRNKRGGGGGVDVL
jgi:ankyrin repeat protein